MKRTFFITMLLHCYLIGIGQKTSSAYQDAPNANLSEIQGFETFNQCTGKLDNYETTFRSYRISELFPAGGFAEFKIYYQASTNSQLKFVAHGNCRTEFRFSTIIKEPGIYYCKFSQNENLKMMIVDARTLELKTLLAKPSKITSL